MSHLPSVTANDLVEAAARLRRLGADGLFRHALPKQQGGHGDGFADLVAAHETLGLATHDPGLILAANAHIWGALFPLLRFGNEAQQQELLPFLVAGEWLGGHAITEPEAGSETAAMRCRAVADADGFLLDGRKRYITNTPIADLLVVYARLDDAISAFLVRRGDPGASFAAEPTVQGCATATMGDVILEECRLPAGRLLGRLGAGGVLLQLSLELERAFVFAGIGGVMQWQLAEAVAFANRRQVKARPLAAQQSVAHRIAEMKLRLETVRLWVRRCAERCDAKQRITIESAATKWYASEVFLQSSLDAVHIFGAHGLEGGLVALVQDAMASRLFSGSTEIQKNIVAAMIGLNMHDAR